MNRSYAPRVDRQASVSVQPDWNQVEELDLAKVTKHLTTSTTVPVSRGYALVRFLGSVQ